MQLKFPLTFLIIACFAITNGFAQSSASLEGKDSPSIGSGHLTLGNEDWTFYLDKESKVYYIDFESISVNLSDIKVVDEQGAVVISDKLWDLPVNTIYELDLKGLNPGNYKIELRSYTGVIEKEVSVTE
jgi:Domain of unknown function (DUF3244)